MHPAAVLVHYRHPELTARCVASLVAHCDGLEAIYIVGNGEAPALRDLARRFEDPRLHWLIQPENLGFGAGCNRGMRAALAAGADAVLLINNDAWVEDDVVAAFCAAEQRYRGQALLTGQIFTPSGARWYAGGDYDLATVRTRHWTRPLQHERRVPFACGCLLWLSRPLIEEVGFFDEAYFLYLEDLDLSLRVQRAGHPIVCLPEVRIRHAPSSSTGGRLSPVSVYYQNRNRWLLLARFGRLRHWLSFVPFYLLGWLRRRFTPQAAASRAALRDALRRKWGPRSG